MLRLRSPLRCLHRWNRCYLPAGQRFSRAPIPRIQQFLFVCFVRHDLPSFPLLHRPRALPVPKAAIPSVQNQAALNSSLPIRFLHFVLSTHRLAFFRTVPAVLHAVFPRPRPSCSPGCRRHSRTIDRHGANSCRPRCPGSKGPPPRFYPTLFQSLSSASSSVSVSLGNAFQWPVHFAS